jgi:hypothetical protein
MYSSQLAHPAPVQVQWLFSPLSQHPAYTSQRLYLPSRQASSRLGTRSYLMSYLDSSGRLPSLAVTPPLFEVSFPPLLSYSPALPGIQSFPAVIPCSSPGKLSSSAAIPSYSPDKLLFQAVKPPCRGVWSYSSFSVMPSPPPPILQIKVMIQKSV